MKTVPKLIRRFVGLLLLSCVLLFALNLVLLAAIAAPQQANSSPWSTAQEVADTLQKTADGGYKIPQDKAQELRSTDSWAILIDNDTRQVVWQTENLPDTVPLAYTLADIAALTRGYIDGYPTFTGTAGDGVVVLGCPRDSYWKHMWPSWDYRFIAHLPQTALLVLAANLMIIFLIYAAANTALLRSVTPIVQGIQCLPAGTPTYIKEKGLLSELAQSINRTSALLWEQKEQLKRKETARANWIAGVSHDIRTPLSMVMGYAAQLARDPGLADGEKKKAAVIVRQSQRIKTLINDLNLASKLEYNMQPLSLKTENITALARQVTADFINLQTDDKYTLEWAEGDNPRPCYAKADKELLKRAIANLIQNSLHHNENGCMVWISVCQQNGQCRICVEDNGVGAADEQIDRLNHAPHYMVCDANTTEQRHGLGLLIVKQIAEAHRGTAEIAHSPRGGLAVTIALPADQQAEA